MIVAIIAAAAIPTTLPKDLPEMWVIDISREVMWAMATDPVKNGDVLLYPSLMFLGDAVSSGASKAPAIVRTFTWVRCTSNEWKMPTRYFYTVAGEGIEERQGSDVWVRGKVGTTSARMVDVACGRLKGKSLPPMPLSVMVSTYRKYRLASSAR